MTDYVQELLAGNFQFVSPSYAWRNNGLESEGEALYVYKDHPVYFEDGLLYAMTDEGFVDMIHVRTVIQPCWPYSGRKYQVWANDRCVLETDNIEETV